MNDKEILDHTNTNPKSPLIKNKYILVVFILGIFMAFLGALGKINSEPWGGTMLTYSVMTSMVSLLLLIVKLIMDKDNKSFLNR